MTFDDGRPPRVTWRYDRAELIADGVVHVLGAVAAVAAAAVLITLAAVTSGAATLSAVTVYAASLLAVIGCSAAYNMWPVSRTKWLLRRFDHAAIFVLIAGTYTPFMIHLGTASAHRVLAAVWTAALAGAALKLAAPGRFDRLAIAFYLVLSWSGALVASQVFEVLSAVAAGLLIAGGVIYSVGVVFHVWHGLRFQNAIWHGFVLVAAGCQYAAVVSGVVVGA